MFQNKGHGTAPVQLNAGLQQDRHFIKATIFRQLSQTSKSWFADVFLVPVLKELL